MSETVSDTWQIKEVKLDCQVCGRPAAVTHHLEFKGDKLYMKPVNHCGPPGPQHPAMLYEMTLTKATNEDGVVLLEREVQ